MTTRPTLTWATGTTGMRHLFREESPAGVRRSVCRRSALYKDKPRTRAQRDPAHMYDNCKVCDAHLAKGERAAIEAAFSAMGNEPACRIPYNQNPPPIELLAEPVDHSKIKVVLLPTEDKPRRLAISPPQLGGAHPTLPLPRENWITRIERQSHYLWAGLLAAIVAKRALEIEADRDALLDLLNQGKPGLGNRQWLIDIRPVRRLLDGRLYLEVTSTSGDCTPTLTTADE